MPFVKASNSKQQNPCEIAGALEAECQGFCVFKLPFHPRFGDSQSAASYVLGPLGQGGNYVTPQKNSTGAQKCECNTVMFRYKTRLHLHPDQSLIVQLCSLYMACTACQNLTTEAWSFWRKYCDAVYVTQYPGDIPLNTAVPNWAYFNYTVRARYRWLDLKASHLISLSRSKITSILSPRKPSVINQRVSHRFLRLSHYLTALRVRVHLHRSR